MFKQSVTCAVLSLVCILAGVGCVSVERKVNELTSKGRYAEALVQLEKAGVGEVVNPKAPPEAQAARAKYQQRVEGAAESAVQSARDRGSAREAAQLATEWKQLCTWSAALATIERECESTVSEIDRLTREWRETSLNVVDERTARESLGRWAAVRTMLADSPAARESWQECRGALLAAIALRLRSTEHEPVDAIQLGNDLGAAGFPKREADLLVETARHLYALPRSTTLPGPAGIHAARSLVKFINGEGQSCVLLWPDVLPAVKEAMLAWADTYLKATTEKDLVHPIEIELAESALPVLGEGSEWNVRVARAHLRCVRFLTQENQDPILSELHLRRAELLSPGTQDASASQSVQAALGAQPEETATVAVVLSPSIEPSVQRLVMLELTYDLVDETRPGFRWVSAAPDKADLVIEITAATRYTPSIADLKPRTSRYLSHYESVPNPEKARLEAAVDGARMAATFAESNYRSQVSIHNFNPTQWSLQAANSAYTNYSMAIDRYNMLVRQYNMTPDTVREPVYLPYSFEEGTFRNGFEFKGVARVRDFQTELEASAVEEDFVRVGTKFEDVDSGYRRDDPLRLNLSTEHTLSLLGQTGSQVLLQLTPLVGKLTENRTKAVDEGSRVLLGWLKHPFGPQPMHPEIPTWAVEAATRIRLPDRAVRPLEVSIFQDGSPVPAATATDFASVLGQFACAVRVSGFRGSGALISGDGLVLTAAHVLRGPTPLTPWGEEIKIVFLEGDLVGEYQAEILFVNPRADVALLRAKGLTSKRWLNVREGPARKGERVIAFGNPDLGAAAESNTITEGTVANPSYDHRGVARLVAGISAASGSSGGPVLSLETGEVLGLVVEVLPPGVNADRSASGYFALVAPSSQFKEWLGLKKNQPAATPAP